MDDVCHQRVDDGGEGAAHDNADGEVDYASAADEVLEFLDNLLESHVSSLLVLMMFGRWRGRTVQRDCV